MKYGYIKRTTLSFADAVQKTKEELAKEGFGILTEIDVKEVMEKKLGAKYDEYVILGACNPPLAHRALQAHKDIGLFLPCNVVVYEDGDAVVVAAILPSAAMRALDNETLSAVAREAEKKLRKVVDGVPGN